NLAVLGPGNLRQFAEGVQLGELRGVVGIGDRPPTQTAAHREGDFVRAADVTDFLEMLVEKAFAMLMKTPLGHDRAAARDDAGDTIDRERDVVKPGAGMDSEVVDALFRLLD